MFTGGPWRPVTRWVRRIAYLAWRRTRGSRRLARWKVEPLSFDSIRQARHRISGIDSDRTACNCPNCRHARRQRKTLRA